MGKERKEKEKEIISLLFRMYSMSSYFSVTVVHFAVETTLFVFSPSFKSSYKIMKELIVTLTDLYIYLNISNSDLIE
jgi:hypothetical protein